MTRTALLMATALAVGMIGAEPAQARAGDPIAQLLNSLNKAADGQFANGNRGKGGDRRKSRAGDDDDDDDDDGKRRGRKASRDSDDDDDDGKGRGRRGGSSRDDNDDDD